MKKKHTKIFLNKSVYLGLPILEISGIVMYEFWYVYLKPKYNGKSKLCYMDTDSSTDHVKAEDIYEDITKDVEERFDTSNYDLER